MKTTTPASIMGIYDRKGVLIADKNAEIVIFDDDIKIGKTLISWEFIYSES